MDNSPLRFSADHIHKLSYKYRHQDAEFHASWVLGRTILGDIEVLFQLRQIGLDEKGQTAFQVLLTVVSFIKMYLTQVAIQLISVQS